MTPDGKTFDPETVTDKQLVQYEQAIDRGLTEADAMRLTEHEYNGFQANAIIAAALNPAVGENVLDALATPKYTAAQMTAIAKIAIRGGDFARFLDPQMDARRMDCLLYTSLRHHPHSRWRAGLPERRPVAEGYRECLLADSVAGSQPLRHMDNKGLCKSRSSRRRQRQYAARQSGIRCQLQPETRHHRPLPDKGRNAHLRPIRLQHPRR